MFALKSRALARRALELVVVAVCIGCNEIVAAEEEVGDESDSETGDNIDQVPCEAQWCDDYEDCCPRLEVGENSYLQMDDLSNRSPALLCGAWPNKWACTNNACEHLGCESNDDCRLPPINLSENWVCVEVDDVGYCVQPCEGDDDCQLEAGDAFQKTECIGEADPPSTVDFCQEPPP